MLPVLAALLAFLGSLLRSRGSLTLQVLALQHQVTIYKQTVRRPRLRPSDRLFWTWLSRLWPRLTSYPRVRPATRRNRMAAEAISRSLAAPEPKWHVWPTCRCQGRQRPDSGHVSGEPAVGLTPNRRGIA
jgi:hypothetical protein